MMGTHDGGEYIGLGPENMKMPSLSSIESRTLAESWIPRIALI